MKLNFLKASPAKNTTVLITDYVNPANYRKLNQAVMSYEYLLAEQVGFIVAPQNKKALLKLQMSGNEFCGNAVLTAAALVRHRGLTAAESFYIEASGVNGLVYCEVKTQAQHLIQAKAEMPKPTRLEKLAITIPDKTVEGCLVHLPGISHFVTAESLTKEEYEQILAQLLHKTAAEALGIIPYQKLAETEYKILPYVYVRDGGSKVFEQACGSGSLALGAYLHELAGKSLILVRQPGGTLTVEAGEKFYLTAGVYFTCEGTLDVN